MAIIEVTGIYPIKPNVMRKARHQLDILKAVKRKTQVWQDILLCLGEATGNLVRHADQPGEFTLTISHKGQSILAEIEADCQGGENMQRICMVIDSTKQGKTHLGGEDGGIGYFIINQLCTDYWARNCSIFLQFDFDDEGNLVVPKRHNQIEFPGVEPKSAQDAKAS